MRETHMTRYTPLGAILTVSLFSMGAWAQSTVLEEITVTAQKREQLAKDVGIAITTFSARQMDALGFESSTDLIAYTPGVSMAGDIGGQRAIFNIRGVVQNDYADLAEAPVAVYVDGGYLASTQAQTFGLYDIDRVEILKGPQGTLFGRNATGGLVNTITARPTEETEGYVELTAASFSQFRLEGALSGAFSDNVRARISFLSNQQDEIYTNIYSGVDAQGVGGTPGGGEDTYNDDTVAVRAQIDFDIGDKGNLLIIANYADTTKSEGPYQVTPTTEVRNADGEAIDVISSYDDPMNCDVIQDGACIDGNGDGSATRPVFGGSFWGDVDPDGSGPKVNKDFAFDDQNKIKSQGILVEFNYEIGESQFTSVTDYKNFTRVIGLDSDQTARAALIFQSDGDTDQFSQEFRFSGETDRMNWVTGFYYLNIDIDFIQGLAESAVGEDDFALLGQEANTITNLQTDSYSIFGQVDYALSDTWTLVAGLRLTQEDKDFEGSVDFFLNEDDRKIETETFLFSIEQLTDENDETLWSGKLQMEFSPGDDALYYFGINRGVKAGSFNAPLFGGLSPYDEEVLISYEAGTKLTLMEGRARLDASIYYYDYNDYQSFSFRNNSSSVTNEDATYKGIDLEFSANPIDPLDIQFGVSYIDATVHDLQITSQIFTDTTPPFTPEWQVSGLARYNWSAFGGNLAAQVNGSWKSEYYFSAKNFTAHLYGSSYTLDARLTWSDMDNRWNVVAFVDNFTDEIQPLIGFDVSGFYGTSQISYTRPRSYGVQLRRYF
jgi:iron complex outermembrane receptor protein